MNVNKERIPRTQKTDESNNPKRRTIFLIPNLITSLALLCGFLAILKASQGAFYTSGLLIFAAAIFDILDGRVARILNASSKFGEEYDSLSDMVSFGISPAITVYLWVLNDLGRIGVAVCGFYCICAALRLARFNINTAIINKKYFQGVPSPVAATALASMILMVESAPSLIIFFNNWLVALIIVMLGGLMVCSIPFYSFKEFDLRKNVSFKIMLAFILLIVFIYLLPEPTFFLLLFGYCTFGFLLWFWRIFRSGRINFSYKSIKDLFSSD